MLLTFLTHPNFLVLFRTGKESQPSSRDSGKTMGANTENSNTYALLFLKVVSDHENNTFSKLCSCTAPFHKQTLHPKQLKFRVFPSQIKTKL